MKLAVVGSRGFSDYDLLKSRLDEEKDITEIISGGAIGADRLAEQYAAEKNIPTTIFKPEWGKHGKAAGMIRNKDIICAADKVIAFWDGKSKGTENSINIAQKTTSRMIS